jgi:pyridoxamine 5'-phosphate oxidase family protein
MGRTGELHVVPAHFRLDSELDVVAVTGRFMGKSKKYRDVQEDPRVAFVVDAFTEKGAPCGVEVRGLGQVIETGGDAIMPGADPEYIRITPTRILSWGIDSAPTAPHSRRVSGR